MKKIITICLSFIFAISLAHAEDIDIYDANAGSSSNPNILIVLDNSSNWGANNQGWPNDPDAPATCGNSCNSKQGYYEVKAIRTLINGLNTTYGDASGNVPINIGLQMFNSTNADRKGTYIRSAIVPMTATNRAALIAKLNTIIDNFNTETASSSVQYSIALWDAFKYFGGLTNPANATNSATTNPSPNPTYSTVPVFGTEFWGSKDADGTNPDSAAYNNNNKNFVPVSVTSCARNYIVFIGNGFPSSENSSENMGDVLSKLINPASPTSVTQFPLNTYSAGTTCSNLTTFPNGSTTGLGCSTSCDTTLANAFTNSLLLNSETTVYACKATSTCTTGKVLQACNSVITSTSPTGNATNRYADEFADFLYRTDVSSAGGQQNIITYTIDVYKNAPSTDQSALMRNMAKYGGGKYFSASDLGQLTKAFDIILSEIQSVNSVFASSSLPISANTQGTYLNQVFVGMFRPETTSAPRWYGNLKQYQMQFFGSELRLADFSSPPLRAISNETGFFTPCAYSAWTTNTGNYWQFNANSAGLCDAATKFSDGPDGATVEKGGAAQRLRGVTSTATSTNYSTRQLKTCDATNCNTLTNFTLANTSLTAAALGVSEGDESAQIDWIRGKDVDNENNTVSFPNAVFNEVRPSVHGGVVHSQPAVVDYGGTIGVVSYYGADDGVFHAVNGNQTSTDGNEYWGFIAPESYPKFKRLRDNSPIIKFPTVATSITPTPLPKDYFFDGSIGVFQRLNTDSSNTVWIYPTMRRGGRAIYAFDVSNPTSPVLKWRRGCYTNSTTVDTNCASGWSGIGQTWSKPQIAYLNGYVDTANNNKPKPVLVFGGGYDTCEDTNNQVRCTATPRKGANIWFVDANTGDIIRTYPTNYSVPGDITLLTNSSGYLTYAYAADTGGYLYRINVGTYDGNAFNSTWTSNIEAANITIASMSETNQARKFLFGPDVIVYAGYNAVAIGSGDREHPLVSSYACNNFATTGVKNQFYIIKDRPTGYPTNPITPSDLTDVTTRFAITESEISNNGLRFDLVNVSTPTALRCEQTVNKALTLGGVTYFGTNAPKSSSEITTSCGINLGISRGYAVDFTTGAPILTNSRSVINRGGGLPPSPVGGIVDINGKKVPFCIGCVDTAKVRDDTSVGSESNDGSSNDSGEKDNNPTAPRQRIYWYLESD